MKIKGSIILSVLFAVFLMASCGKKTSKKSHTTETNSKNGHKLDQKFRTVHKDSLTNLIQIETPTTSNIVISNAYIHSVEKVKYNGKRVLLIKGDLPNGCSKLYHVYKSIDGNTLTLTLSTWKPQNQPCTQALQPFSFIYDGLNYFDYHSVTHIKIAGQVKAF